MSLLRVELSRFRSRRAIVLVLLAGALLAGLLAATTLWNTRPLTAADLATAQAQANIDGANPAIKDEVDKCRHDPVSYLGPGGTMTQCDALVPDPSTYLSRQPLSLHQVLEDNGMRLAVVLVALMVIIGATFAGADWASGSLDTQLLFEPRRRRLWTAKAATVALGSAVATLVILAAFWLTLYLTAVGRQTPHGSGIRMDITLHVLRVVVLAMAAAVGSFALTMLFRSTVGTLGLLFTASLAGEILSNLLPVDGVARWTLGNNLYAWAQKDFRFFDSTVTCNPGNDCSQLVSMGHLEGGGFLLVLLVVACTLSLAAFSRRDV